MCFTQGMSLVMSTCSFAFAWYEYKRFNCLQYALGIAYFGLMEFLQVIQHSYAAVPEDNYAMCSSEINRRLTDLGIVHIAGQPIFICFGLLSMYRRVSFSARIESDLIFKLCLTGLLWFGLYPVGCAIFGWKQQFAPPATEDCPNYQWLLPGYDAALNWTTPNDFNEPCTFYPPTKSGHLAWAVPTFRQSYFLPGNSVHCFLMFAPYFTMFKRRFVQMSAIVLFLSGPVLAAYITPSVHEQPAVWCFYSVAQTFMYAFCVRYYELHNQEVPDSIHHPGARGEEPLTYYTKEAILNGAGSAEEPLLKKPVKEGKQPGKGKKQTSRKG